VISPKPVSGQLPNSRKSGRERAAFMLVAWVRQYGHAQASTSASGLRLRTGRCVLYRGVSLIRVRPQNEPISNPVGFMQAFRKLPFGTRWQKLPGDLRVLFPGPLVRSPPKEIFHSFGGWIVQSAWTRPENKRKPSRTLCEGTRGHGEPISLEPTPSHRALGVRLPARLSRQANDPTFVGSLLDGYLGGAS
jgi:hypothetical protein